MVLDPVVVEPSFYFGSWFQNEDVSPFHVAHEGKSLWEYAAPEPEFNKIFNEAMQSDYQLISILLLAHTEFKGLVEGVTTLVDVGGGNGTLARDIARAFPNLMCIVFYQSHVINSLDVYESNIEYVGGDMFESIPNAQVLLLKFILHDWNDDHCIKILECCKDAIPSKDEGGKILIIDMVVQTNNEIPINSLNSQFLLDIEMMSLTVGGKERTDEEEWIKLLQVLVSLTTSFSIY